MVVFFFFKQKTAYEMRISDWSSDVCSSDLPARKRLLVSGPALAVEAFPQELQVRNARNFDRILKAQEKACGGPLMRFHREQILSFEYCGAARRLISRPATQGIGKRRLPPAVWRSEARRVGKEGGQTC